MQTGIGNVVAKIYYQILLSLMYSCEEFKEPIKCIKKKERKKIGNKPIMYFIIFSLPVALQRKHQLLKKLDTLKSSLMICYEIFIIYS